MPRQEVYETVRGKGEDVQPSPPGLRSAADAIARTARPGLSSLQVFLVHALRPTYNPEFSHMKEVGRVKVQEGHS